jgi:putative endonuclease
MVNSARNVALSPSLVILSEAKNLALAFFDFRIVAGNGGQRMKTYYVYIVASASRTLYTGVTNNLERRALQHRTKLRQGFTARYNVSRLVYYEDCGDIRAAISREKQIKGWVRARKVALIESVNRDWKDLSGGWYGEEARNAGQGKRPERDSSLRSE